MKKLLVTIPDNAVKDTFLPASVRARLERLFAVDYNETGRQYEKEELKTLLLGYDAVLTGWGTRMLDKEVLSENMRLRLIAHTGGSVGNLVDGYAYEKGITVLSGNRLYAESVAEGTIAYMLTALRRIPDYMNRVKNGLWRTEADEWEGLLDKTVGIIGLGSISTILIEMLRVFRVKIKVYPGYEISEETLKKLGVRKASLDEIFGSCDIVSVHAALNDETRGMIGKTHFERLKDNALFINTARGDILDEKALTEELQKNRFRAVLDVYHEEPLPENSPLRTLSNVYAVPHMGGPTSDRRPFITEALIDEMRRFFDGETGLELKITKEQAARMTRM